MPIVRSNDPRANDKAHQIKTVLGKMCDSEISIETKRACVQKLTELLQGMPMSESTFTEFGIQARLIKEKDETMLHVHVPKEYVLVSKKTVKISGSCSISTEHSTLITLVIAILLLSLICRAIRSNRMNLQLNV